MASQLKRLQSASDLRTWEEVRAKKFVKWHKAIGSLVQGLRQGLHEGSRQSRDLDAFLRQRALAERAYAAALAAPPTPADPPQGQHATNASASNAPEPARGRNSLMEALAGLQKATGQARETFAASLLEGSALSGISATTTEFETTGSGLLTDLESSLKGVCDANTQVVDAMSVYHRSVFIESKKSTSSSSTSQGRPPVPDIWLHEHRYRRAVQALLELQHGFMTQLSGGIHEMRRLEEWRHEMCAKLFGRFCTKLFQVETAVQSLANDGVKSLASEQRHPGENFVLKGLDKMLSMGGPEQTEGSEEGSPASTGTEPWPLLRSLAHLGVFSRPPASVLGVMAGPIQAPRRWYGSQLCMLVLTKDEWLHSFPFSETKAKAAGGKGKQNSEAHPASSRIESLEADPQWSLYIPSVRITAPVPGGKPKTFELEEVRRGFLGMKSTHKELIQVDTDEDYHKWVSTLQQMQSGGLLEADAKPELAGPAPPAADQQAARAREATSPPARPPPPPPPPPQPPSGESAALPPTSKAGQVGGDPPLPASEVRSSQSATSAASPSPPDQPISTPSAAPAASTQSAAATASPSAAPAASAVGAGSPSASAEGAEGAAASNGTAAPAAPITSNASLDSAVSSTGATAGTAASPPRSLARSEAAAGGAASGKGAAKGASPQANRAPPGKQPPPQAATSFLSVESESVFE